jgi:RNA polymerase sigma-70 factor, ECF subfamily
MAAHARKRDRSTGNRRDKELVLRARAGDEEAQKELYHRYYPIFRNWVHRWLKCEAWERECVDHLMANLFEELIKYRPGGSAFCSWAFMISRSEMVKHIHELGLDRGDFPLDEEIEETLVAPTGPMDAYGDSRLHEEVKGLEPERGAAVGGCYFEGKTEKEVAEEQHIPRRRVSYRIHQALAELNKRLADVAFMWIRPQVGYFRNSYTMTNAKDSRSAQLGGEEGDYA